jgi:hypothetical protein
LQGIIIYAVVLGGKDIKEIWLVGFMDSDFAENQKTRRSTGGFVFKFGGRVISWSSKKQQIVTISTIESKYCALKEAG